MASLQDAKPVMDVDYPIENPALRTELKTFRTVGAQEEIQIIGCHPGILRILEREVLRGPIENPLKSGVKYPRKAYQIPGVIDSTENSAKIQSEWGKEQVADPDSKCIEDNMRRPSFMVFY